MRSTTYFLALLVFFSLITIASAENRYAGSFALGVKLFYQKDYEGAITAFEKAEVADEGNHAAYLWHGLALVGNGDKNEAPNIWQKMPWDTKAKALSYYFSGLTYWRAGETSSAKYWLENSNNYKETPGYKLSKKALLALLNDEKAPVLEAWPTLASLPGAQADQAEADNEQNAADKKPNAEPAKAGAEPKAGLWEATITSGYKGQKLSFRVSADAKTISDIIFKGYLICRGSKIQDTELAPLRDVPIKNGAFFDTQLNGGAKVRFDFTGVFNTATKANGTYRVISDTECDTYELKWSASRVGN